MPRLFGSSGIRGPYPGGVDLSLALRLGRAAASAGRILVGHDVRLSSPLLAEAFVAGALGQGARVAFAGAAATPSLAYAARDHGLAVAVTASHNPPPDNGFKFWNPDGAAWSGAQEAALEARLRDAPAAPPPWDRLAPRDADDGVSARHRDAVLRFVGPLSGRVVLDCGNGAGAYISPALFASAGLDVELLFADPDGRFPNRPSEPSPENLAELRRRCAAAGAWGIAHDGDADRMVAVDPHGDVVAAERVLVALALLRGARRVATPVDASRALERALPGARWDLCRVGDAAVSATLRAAGGDLGGETSGTFIVPAFDYAPDGPLAALLFLRAAGEGLVDEAARRLKPLVRVSEKAPLAGIDRGAFGERLARVEPSPGERATRVDGLRLDTDRGWVLVRPSGTEPIVRVTAEAATADDAKALLARGRDVVRAATA